MKLLSPVTISSGAIFVTIFVPGCREPSDSSAIKAPQDLTSIKTNFDSGRNLSTTEIQQVIELARRCGITNVAEIATFPYLPTFRFGISVKGRETISGRNRSYDEITIDNMNLTRKRPDKDSLRLGTFLTEKYATHFLLREYTFKEETFNVDIFGVDVAVADKIISSIFEGTAHGNVPFDRLFDPVFKLPPNAFYLQKNEKGGYTFDVSYAGGTRGWTISVEVRNGEVFVVGGSDYVV